MNIHSVCTGRTKETSTSGWTDRWWICKPPSTLRPSNVWYCFFHGLISSQHKSAAFTRAVNCLARYGDELVICAYPDYFSLSTTNSAKSAYCRFKYEKEFFSRYKAGKRRSEINEDDLNGVQMVTAQLLTKVAILIYTDILPDSLQNLLSVLKHRSTEKSVERCELSIVEGLDTDPASDEEVDSLESKLVIKFLCKHGAPASSRFGYPRIMGSQALSKPIVLFFRHPVPWWLLAFLILPTKHASILGPLHSATCLSISRWTRVPKQTLRLYGLSATKMSVSGHVKVQWTEVSSIFCHCCMLDNSFIRQGTNLDRARDQRRRVWCLRYIYLSNYHCFSSTWIQCERRLELFVGPI